jgi:hypothetical protein
MLGPMKGWQIFWNTHLFADEAGADRLPRLHPNETLGPHLPEPHPRLTRARAAQGGVTLGLEQGEPEADFSHLGGLTLASKMVATFI